MFRIVPPFAQLATLALAIAPARAQWSIEALSEARGTLVAVTVDNFVLFAGGDDPSTGANSARVDIYNSSTGIWTWGDHLSVARAFLCGTAVGHYALFAGGGVDSQTPLDTVDIFDSQTGLWSQAHLSQARSQLAAASVGGEAIFAGGSAGLGLPPLDTVDIYDSSLGSPDDQAAWRVAPPLFQGRTGMAAASVGDVALFAGGVGPLGYVDTVDIYDSIGHSWSVATLHEARAIGLWGSATIGTRAYFAGGDMANQVMSDTIDIYDSLTGLWSDMALPERRSRLSAAALGNVLVLAGGFDATPSMTPVVHMLNVGTGQWDSTSPLTEPRWAMGAAAIDGRVIFGGGRGINAAPASDRIDVYEPIGVSYCAATPNSTGGAATISASGSQSVAANDLTLTVGPVPNQPGLFFYGPAQVQLAFGNGFLCVGAGATGIARLPVGNAAGNVMTYTLDNTAPPTALTQILPGTSWNFSAWFRDPLGLGASFDLSDAISVSFTP